MDPLLRIENLTKVFAQGRQQLRAVDEVSFEIFPGETVETLGGREIEALSKALALAKMQGKKP